MKRRIRRLWALPPAERRLLVRATLLLGVIRLGLGLLPFRTVLRLLNLVARPNVASAKALTISPNRIAWAVTVVSPYVLGIRPCLTQALAVQTFLRRRGSAARIHLGVARGDRGQVEAHAWVEHGGKVVIGGSLSELARYTPLLALDPQTT